jgi:hypothetical protein
LRFEASEDHNWRAFPLQATFTHEASGDTLVLDAYWDDGKTWCVRFAPTKPGPWTYRIESNDPAFGGKTGQIDCVALTPSMLESDGRWFEAVAPDQVEPPNPYRAMRNSRLARRTDEHTTGD